MNIQDGLKKIKALARFLDKKDVYVSLIIAFSSLGSFLLGISVKIERTNRPVTIYTPQKCALDRISSSEPEKADLEAEKGIIAPKEGQKTYVGSKSGSKYHLPDCPGAKMISEANKIWFSSRSEAEKAGYTAAGNCKGL